MFYHIKDTLIECDISELKNTEFQYVSVLTKEEWMKYKDSFDLGIDMELDLNEIHSTKAVVNYDSLTGTFMIPDRNNITEQYYKFTFVLDEKGIIFIDDSGRVKKMIRRVCRQKRWRMPSLERFIYDFLEQIIYRDQQLMEQYELELDKIEDAILKDVEDVDLNRISDIRSDIREAIKAGTTQPNPMSESGRCSVPKGTPVRLLIVSVKATRAAIPEVMV